MTFSEEHADEESTDFGVVESPAIEPEADVVAAPASPIARVLDWCRRRKVAVGAVALVVGSALAAGSVYWWVFRPDQLTNSQAQQQVVAAAKEGIEAALSYSPESLDKDLANAKSHLTGKFLEYYSEFTATVVAPASKQKGVKTEANVARAAVSEMRPDKAAVLVFVNQVTSSKERPTPALAASTVMVTLVKSGNRWLISEFNPI